MGESIRFLPDQASAASSQVDFLSLILLIISFLFTAGIALTILFFVLRYWHARDVNRVTNKSAIGHWGVELTWSIIPLIVTLIVFVWGAALYFQMHNPPADAIDLSVVGKQWMWKTSHPEGKREINQLHVPTGRSVRLTMISEDVIHSFYVPAFRVKHDVLPGRYSTLWFEPTKPGIYHLFCAEYCGTDHSRMIGSVVVQSPEDYAKWLADDNLVTQQEAGYRLLNSYKCFDCHGATNKLAPSLVGLFGHEVPLSDEKIVTADEAYIRRSILEPKSQIVAGFASKMPSFEGQLDPEQILQIIAYLKSVSDASGRVSGPGVEP